MSSATAPLDLSGVPLASAALLTASAYVSASMGTTGNRQPPKTEVAVLLTMDDDGVLDLSMPKARPLDMRAEKVESKPVPSSRQEQQPPQSHNLLDSLDSAMELVKEKIRESSPSTRPHPLPLNTTITAAGMGTDTMTPMPTMAPMMSESGAHNYLANSICK